MNEHKFALKQLLYIAVAGISFLVMLFLCIRMKASGVPFLICLILQTCAFLLLYQDVLTTADSKEWDTEPLWQDENHSEEIADRNKEEEEAFSLKHIYAEVKESLIDAPLQAEELSEKIAVDMTEEIADNISSETILPSPEEGTLAAAVIPDALNTFLARPKSNVEMDLIAAAKDAMDSLTSFAEAQKIKLHLSTTCKTLPMMADPDSIRILFRNIIDNSIKYMGRPGHMIITISLLGDDIFLILKDTGMGLSEDETEHVFELNFQGSNRVSGNGLGLTQTKMIVEAFGGTIYAKSSPGNGMAIYIQLPVSGTPAES